MAQKIKFINKNRSEFFPVLKSRVDAYFEDRKLSRHANGLMIFKLFLFIGGVFIPLGLLLTLSMPLIVDYLCWMSIGFFSACCGLGICHDALHGSLFKSNRLNQIFGYLFNVVGANGYIWDIMHNKVHHSFTNIEGHDEDLEAVPILRLSPHKPRKSFHRFQHKIALPLYGFATIGWVFFKDYVRFSMKKIGNYETPSHPTSKWVELIIGKVVYYTLFVVLPFLLIDAPWYHILFGFLLSHYIEGFWLAIIFMLAHMVEETHFPLPNEEGNIEYSWAAHQLYTTADFCTEKPLLSFFAGGLNFQVEHHLFPKVSHVHLPALSKIVRKTAAEHGLPYFQHPTMYDAIRSHVALLKRFGTQG